MRIGRIEIGPGLIILIILVILGLTYAGLKQMGIDLKSYLPSKSASNSDSSSNSGKTPDGKAMVGNEQFNTLGVGNAPDGKADIDRPIRVAVVTWPGYAGGMLANSGLKPNADSLYTKKYGIQVEFVVIDDFTPSRDAFRAGGDRGGVDILWTTADAFALEADGLASLNPKAIIQNDWSRGGDAIAARAGLNKIEDLKGKTVALAEGTPSHYFLLYMLKQQGINPADVKVIKTDSAIDAANIFKAGKVDACVSWAPDVYTAAKSQPGGHIVVSTQQATNIIADLLIARGDFIEKHPEACKRFVQGWLEGVELANKNHDLAAKLLSTCYKDFPEDLAKEMLGYVKLPNYWEDRQFFEIDGDSPTGFQKIFENASQTWVDAGLLTRDHVKAAGQVEELRFLKAIKPAFPQKAAQQEFKFDDKKPDEKAEPLLVKRVSVSFASNSSTLDENAKTIIDIQVAQLVGSFGSSRIKVVGNTDAQGDRNRNIELSRARAESVVKYLVERHSFPREKFIVEGKGPDNPLASNDTEDGRSKNRRTDVEVEN
jgi:NitT/TauT family transport system substrate-binding protein